MDDLLKNVDPDDLGRVTELLNKLKDKQKYSSSLLKALEQLYWWQKQAIEFTANHKVTGLICGNQMGKTEAACAIVACHALGVYPDWWKGRKFTKPPKIMIAGQDSNFNKNTLQDRLFGTNNKRIEEEIGTKMLPKDSIIFKSLTTIRSDDIKSARIKHSSGGTSEIIFKAYSDGRKAAQGYPADIVYIDEQPPSDFFEEVMTRTAATRGMVFCAFTPLESAETKLIRSLMDLPPVEGCPKDKFGPQVKTDNDWAMVRANWDDAPHIKDQESLKKGYESYTLPARVYGMPIPGRGRIYPYDEDYFIYNPKELHIPEGDAVWLGAVDIGNGNGNDETACILACKWKDEYYVTAENFAQTNTTHKIAKAMWSVDARVQWAWPSDAGKRFANAPSSTADQLRKMNVKLLPKPFLNPRNAEGKQNNWIWPGVTIINELFEQGRLHISSDCPRLIKQIVSWQKDEKGDPKKPLDGDDGLDAFRYCIVSIDRFAKKLEFRNSRLYDFVESNEIKVNRY